MSYVQEGIRKKEILILGVMKPNKSIYIYIEDNQ